MTNANGGITQVRGLFAAHQTDEVGKTGCTFIMAPGGAVGAVDVRGGAPGTRETDAFSPLNLVERVHGVMLCGGSAFGLAACDGAMRALEEKGIGFDVGVARVPIIGGAVLFDLGYGDAGARPTAQMGYAAAQMASKQPLAQGSVGAGTGATVCKLLGPSGMKKGGVGTHAIKVGEATLAACFAVNAVGEIYSHHTGQPVRQCTPNKQQKGSVQPGTNTTIGVIATDAVLTRTQAQRLAMMAHDGLAMTIRPVHTLNDGDTAFALCTGEVDADVNALFAQAALVVAQAILNAVEHA